MPYNTNPTRTDLLKRANSSRLTQVDPVTRGEAPVGHSSGDWDRGLILTCDANLAETALVAGSITGGDWTSPGSDTTQLVLPIAKIRQPMLRRCGLIQWEVVGFYENTGGVATNIVADLMVDGAAVGSPFTWAQGAVVVSSPGIIIFNFDLRVVGKLTSPRHVVTAEVTVLNTAGTAIIGGAASNTKLSQIFTVLVPTATMTLGWRVQKSVSNANLAMAIQSIGCYMPMRTSGV